MTTEKSIHGQINLMEREHLWEIMAACRRQVHKGMNASWVKAFEELEFAACTLDAFLARSTVAAGVPDPIPDPLVQEQKAA